VAIKRDPAQEAAIIAWIQVIGQDISSREGDWSTCFKWWSYKFTWIKVIGQFKFTWMKVIGH
jgi:hypothetical protein